MFHLKNDTSVRLQHKTSDMRLHFVRSNYHSFVRTTLQILGSLCRHSPYEIPELSNELRHLCFRGSFGRDQCWRSRRCIPSSGFNIEIANYGAD